MNVNSAKCKSQEVKKTVFTRKPVRRDGLILQIHHTVQDRGKPRRIRFLYTAFDSSGSLVANADISGNIFIVDLACNKFWLLPNFKSCSVVSFSNSSSNELIVGTNDGGLFVLNIHVGEIIGVLAGHKGPVKHVSFANDHCLTASAYEAIVYDLKTYAKLHELTLVYQTALKQVTFMPVTHDVLVCFCDDFIHVWKYGSFESYKRIAPKAWQNMSLRSIAMTRNGSSMVLAGHGSNLVVFSLDSWQVTRVLHLPAGINRVKAIEFLAQDHDAGANRFLVVLSTDGALYFLDLEHSFVVGKLQRDVAVVSFTLSPTGGRLACVLHSGEVDVYLVQHYTERLCLTKAEESTVVPRGKVRLCLPKQPRQHLDLATLRGVLKEFGEYPESYRPLIWAQILQLPDNRQCYGSLVDVGGRAPVGPQKSTPVNAGGRAPRSMDRLLANLGAWCPALVQAPFLPLLVFPFVRVFAHEPLQCFEAVLTIVLNWCQHWFQYLPKPPVNVLAMVETVLHEHDPQLLEHLVSHGVTTLGYAWPLLETGFSEALSGKAWAALWDNVVSNEPAFLLMLVVAYNMLFRAHLLTLTTPGEFDAFYRNQNAVSVRKLVGRARHLLDTTSARAHPRQYLKRFAQLPTGSYPVFEDYPKIVVETVDEHARYAEETEARLQQLEDEVARYKLAEEERQTEMERREEEARRLEELEDLYEEKALKERDRLEHQRLHLSRLRTTLHERQAAALEVSRQRIEASNLKERQRQLAKLLAAIDRDQTQSDLEVQHTEEELSRHYLELLKQKEQLDGLLLASTAVPCAHSRSVDEQRQKLNTELDAIRCRIQETRLANGIRVPAAISALEEQLQDLDLKAARQTAEKQQRLVQAATCAKIQQMEHETTALEDDVQRLLSKLAKVRTTDSCNVVGEVYNSTRESLEGMEREKRFLVGSRGAEKTLGCYCGSE